MDVGSGWNVGTRFVQISAGFFREYDAYLPDNIRLTERFTSILVYEVDYYDINITRTDNKATAIEELQTLITDAQAALEELKGLE
jgi:hypothetical protein